MMLPGLAPFEVTARKRHQPLLIPGLSPTNLRGLNNPTPMSVRLIPQALNTAVGMMSSIVKQIREEHPNANYVAVGPDGIVGLDSATEFTERLVNEDTPFFLVLKADHERFR